MICNRACLNPDADLKVDSREPKWRINPVIDFFGSQNVVVGLLETGDYIYKDLVCVEYKTASDMVSSIIDKRIFNQVKRMRTEFPYHYVLVEGNMVETIVKLQQELGVKFSVVTWDGVYSSLNQVTDFIFANNIKHACHLMKLHFTKCLDGKNRDYTYLEKYNNPAITYLSCINGVGYNTAEIVANKLEIKSLNDLLTLNQENLTTIKGIGVKTADKILGAIK